MHIFECITAFLPNFCLWTPKVMRSKIMTLNLSKIMVLIPEMKNNEEKDQLIQENCLITFFNEFLINTG